MLKLIISSLYFFLISFTRSSSIQQNLNSVADGVNLTAISSTVVSGFTSSIEIRCSIRGNVNPSMSSIISIFVSHSNKTDQPVFNYMASINALDGHVRNFTDEVSDVSGAVDSNGESFLSFSLKHPGSARAGVYKCEVNGFDQIGKPLTLTNTLTVTESRPTVSDLLKEMKRKMRSIADYQRFIGKLKSRIYIIKDELFYPPLQYGGSQYYLIKMLAYSIVSEAQATCNLFGGYLFEVDTHEKYQFFANFIRRLDVFELTMTDATDEEQEGVWRSAHSSNSSPTTDWTPGRPLSDRTRNCQCFERHFWWTLSDCFCVYNYDDRNLDMKIAGYICEIPN